MTSFLFVNWSDNTVTIKKSTEVYCEELQPGGAVKRTVRNELWEGIVESVWDLFYFSEFCLFCMFCLNFLMKLKLGKEVATGGVLVKKSVLGLQLYLKKRPW